MIIEKVFEKIPFTVRDIKLDYFIKGKLNFANDKAGLKLLEIFVCNVRYI